MPSRLCRRLFLSAVLSMDTWQLEPEQSTSAIVVVHHPQARYFMMN
jgi:cobalamin-dependent methionine synthase I